MTKVWKRSDIRVYQFINILIKIGKNSLQLHLQYQVYLFYWKIYIYIDIYQLMFKYIFIFIWKNILDFLKNLNNLNLTRNKNISINPIQIVGRIYIMSGCQTWCYLIAYSFEKSFLYAVHTIKDFLKSNLSTTYPYHSKGFQVLDMQ